MVGDSIATGGRACSFKSGPQDHGRSPPETRAFAAVPVRSAQAVAAAEQFKLFQHYEARLAFLCVLKRVPRVDPSRTGEPHCGSHCHDRTAAPPLPIALPLRGTADLTRHLL